jgi:hypothetical protein
MRAFNRGVAIPAYVVAGVTVTAVLCIAEPCLLISAAPLVRIRTEVCPIALLNGAHGLQVRRRPDFSLQGLGCAVADRAYGLISHPKVLFTALVPFGLLAGPGHISVATVGQGWGHGTRVETKVE